MDSETRGIAAERRLRELDGQLQDAAVRCREAERQRQEAEGVARNAEAAAKQVCGGTVDVHHMAPYLQYWYMIIA